MVINVVGLTRPLIGQHTPNLQRLLSVGSCRSITPQLPAVTCAAQATYLTGTSPREHGIVGNGWFFKDTSEVRLWQQSDALVQRPRVWDVARKIDPAFTCANCFWWYAMYSSADVTVTPRPQYRADGRKLPDVWTHPPTLRDELQKKFGQFPLFKFWGPMSSIESSTWITSAAIEVSEQFKPTLNLVYLPHLDYCLQKFGPGAKEIDAELGLIDKEVGRLLKHAATENIRVIVLSEYGITRVSKPIHINRALRNAGLLTLRIEAGRELLDCAASAAFALADHQIAHVYINDVSRTADVLKALSTIDGINNIYSANERNAIGLNHERAGDVIVVSQPDAWFTYYWWLDDAVAPDYARTVDIHRKPGYDPAELFLDPSISLVKLKIAAKLLKRKLGLRALLDVIPLDATLIKGSHGAMPLSDDAMPVLISSEPAKDSSPLRATDVMNVMLGHVFDLA